MSGRGEKKKPLNATKKQLADAEKDKALRQKQRNAPQTKYSTPVSKGFTPNADSVLKTKPVAVSSFIIPPEEKQEAEDLMPDKQDWDASVIEPLKKLDIIANKRTTKPAKVTFLPMAKEISKMNTAGNAKRALASVKKQPNLSKNKEPLKAQMLPSTSVCAGPKPSINNSDKSEIAQSLQELENLYDDYLLSELMRMNTKQNYDFTREQINNEVIEMWSALEMVRVEVISLKEKNEKNKNMIAFYEAATSESPNIEKNITTEFPELCEQMKQLADALEQSTHHLKIMGAKVDPNDDTENTLLRVLKETLSTLSLQDKSNEHIELLKKNATQISELNINLESSLSAFDRCKDLLKKLKSATLHATSLFLSNSQLLDDEKYSSRHFNPLDIKCAMDESDSSDDSDQV